MRKKIVLLVFFACCITLPSNAQWKINWDNIPDAADAMESLGNLFTDTQVSNMKREAENLLAAEKRRVESQSIWLKQLDKGSLFFVEFSKYSNGNVAEPIVKAMGNGETPAIAYFEGQKLLSRYGAWNRYIPGVTVDEDNSFYVFFKPDQFGNINRTDFETKMFEAAVNSTDLKTEARRYQMATRPAGARGWRCNYKNHLHTSPYECYDPDQGGHWE
jgi:hypothetical protein